MFFSLDEATIPKMWIGWLKSAWQNEMGAHPWRGDEMQRCDFCGRRLGREHDFLVRVSRSPSGKTATFTGVCLNHGAYDGQLVMDCFTAAEMTLRKEPRFYHETAILHEAWFFISAACKFVREFFRELPLNILCSIDLPIRKAIKKQEERLGYK
jgi:hypothetical protein